MNNPVDFSVINPYGDGTLMPGTAGPAITGSPNPNVFDTSSGAYNTGIAGMAGASSPMAPMMSMNMFMNPYRNMVLDNALDRLRDQQDLDLNMVQGSAASAGAFGGARHGLVEAELMDRYSRNAGELATTILSSGFDTTADLGLRSVDQQQRGYGELIRGAPVGFQMGQSAMAGQAAAGEQQQRLLQMILDMAGGNTDAFAAGPSEQLRAAIMGSQGNPLAGRTLQTQQYNPGMFDYLSMGMGVLGGGK